jgi:hypothetical protein
MKHYVERVKSKRERESEREIKKDTARNVTIKKL